MHCNTLRNRQSDTLGSSSPRPSLNCSFSWHHVHCVRVLGQKLWVIKDVHFTPMSNLLILENAKWNSCLEGNFIIRLKRLKHLTYSISWCVLTNSSSLKSFSYIFLLGNLNLSPLQKLLYSLPSTYFTVRQSVRPTISTVYNFHYTSSTPSSELRGTQTNLLWSLGIYKHI